jgi:hypothetical protein
MGWTPRRRGRMAVGPNATWTWTLTTSISGDGGGVSLRNVGYLIHIHAYLNAYSCHQISSHIYKVLLLSALGSIAETGPRDVTTRKIIYVKHIQAYREVL